MMRRPGWLAFTLVLGIAGAPGGAAAQLPGESLNNPRVSIRGEYLAHTYKEVQQVLADWAELVEGKASADLTNLIAKDVVFSPLEGWLAKGEQQVGAALLDYLPRISGYGLSIIDFDASASLAYVLGATYYQLAEASNRRFLSGQVAIILSRQGTRWKLRSYLERPAPTEP